MKHLHSKLLDLAARRHLAPLGLARKGRSRTWLDDRHWYAIVVEFQPSSYSKGSFLNVGAHFLWSTAGHLSFDLGHRVCGLVEFESEAQFAPEADRLAVAATLEIERLRALLTGVQTVASLIPVEQRDGFDGWPSYHRAIALGLSGNVPEASSLFTRLASPSNPVPWQVELATRCLELQRLLANPTEFRATVARMIQQQRCALKLPELAEPLTPLTPV